MSEPKRYKPIKVFSGLSPTNVCTFDAVMEENEKGEYYKASEVEIVTPEIKAVIDNCLQFDSCMSEFDGEIQYCGEYLDHLFDAIDKLRQVER